MQNIYLPKPKINQEEFDLQKAYFQQLFDNSPQGIVMLDQNDNILRANESFYKIFNYSLQEILNKNIDALIAPSQLYTEATSLTERAKKGEFIKKNIMRKIKGGALKHFSLLAYPIMNGKNQLGIYAIYQDITHEKENEEKINQLAYRDSLTGLYNRTSFNMELTDSIERASKSQKMLAILFLDLDGFKKINDNLGHSIGDNLLKIIGDNLKRTLGNNTTIARIGGDEFTVLLNNISSIQEVIKVADQILNIFVPPWIFDNYNFYISTSIGISIYPEHGSDNDSLIRKADMAMYRAKENGRNQYIFYSPSLSEKVNEEFNIDNNLRNALERKEFSVHYQPIIDIKSNKIIGAEALLRWNQSTMGSISPYKFIPIAEKNGLIIPIGLWVLKEACLQNKKWQNLGLPSIFISVNISVKQLQQRDFLFMVSEVLEETKLDAKYLVLEITESFSAENMKNIIPLLDGLKALGVRLSIDDFGTGYSSLSQLSKLTINTLKIDQSFINDMSDDPDNNSIISAIIAIAKNLDLKVVAEGVETKRQLDLLKKYHCDMMQGYFYSPPVPTEDFQKLLMNGYTHSDYIL